MDEQELDDWFGEEREKLETTYYESAQAGKDLEKLRVTFDTNLRKLLAQYQTKQSQLYDQERRRAALAKPIARYHAFVDERKQRIDEWWTGLVTGVRAWFFHQKIKRILKSR